MSTDIARLSFIDALRGYAILGVIAVHSSQLFPGLELPFRILADQGARGIQLFFVVSALTLMLSWHVRNDEVLPFYIRRIFRIAPMFWLAIIYYVALNSLTLRLGHWGPNTVLWPNILASATFLHGFYPDAINSIVPGGWTIADEMTFYVLFPFLVWAIRSWQTAAFAMLVAGCFAWGVVPLSVKIILPVLFPTASSNLLSEFSGLFFPYQFPAFLVGILVSHLLRTFSERLPRAVLQIGLVGAILLIAALPFLQTYLLGRIHWLLYFLLLGYPLLIYSLAFGLVAFCLAQGVGSLLINAPIRYIGKVSYSAYFWHFAVLELVDRALDPPGLSHLTPVWPWYLSVFVGAVALTMLGSTLTFHVIEAPMIRLGRQLAEKIAAIERA